MTDFDFVTSKSRHVESENCPLACWLLANDPGSRAPSDPSDPRIVAGEEFGAALRDLFAGGALVSYDRDFSKMAAATDALLDAGETTIYEASFEAGGMRCSVDVLRVLDASGRVCEIHEGKSSVSLRPHYVADAGFQAAVLAACGWTVAGVFVSHADRDYVRHGDLDLGALIADEDVTDAALEYAATVPARLARAARIAAGPAPACTPSTKCRRCGFAARCRREAQGCDYGVTDVAGYGETRGAAALADGVRTLADLDAALPVRGRSPRVAAQLDCALRGVDEVVDAEALSSFVASVEYPISFLDFEAVAPVLPRWDGCRPYQQVVTQFSMHVMDGCGDLRHEEFLAASDGSDPRRAVAEALVAAAPATGSVVVYSRAFESTRLAEMAEAFPDLAEALLSIRGRVVDLMAPFKKGWLHLAAQRGSDSIKAVLPAMRPCRADLDYHALPGPANGAAASAAFLSLADMALDDAEAVRAALLEYCGLDTMAMVEVWGGVVERAAQAAEGGL